MTNSFTLHGHQEKFIRELRASLRDHQAVLGQAATGFGKTVVASFMTDSASKKGNDIIFMVHRRELIEQTSKTFTRAGIPHTFIANGYHHNPRMRVAIASVGTIANRLDMIRPPKLLIPDEAHHCLATSWSQTVNWAKSHKSKIVGLTATPWRLNGDGLGQHFGHMVLGPSVSWLMKNGFLSQYRAFAPSAPNLSGVHQRGGDYVTAEIEQVMMGKAVIADFVGHWKAKAYGKRTIGFATSVKHSQALVDEFNAAGIPAAHLDATTPAEYRKQYILNFATGHIKVLFNVDLFGEGFDLSAIAGYDVPVEAVILGRPTQSLTLHLQQMGRALRPKSYPAIILDHAGNIMRHGLPDSDYEWSLEGRDKKKKEGDGIRIKQCPQCYYVHAVSLHECPECGHRYIIKHRSLDHVDGDLREITQADMRPKDTRPDHSAKPLQFYIDQAYGQGMKAGDAELWAAKQYTTHAAFRRKLGKTTLRF